MVSVRRPRVIALVAAAMFAASFSIAMARPKPAPVEAVAPPPPPPPAPAAAAGLPYPMLADAAAYQAWLGKVSSTSPDFKSGVEVAQSLKAGAAYEPKALVRGAIAYAAVAALADQTFVSQLRAAGSTPEYRHQMAGYILYNPVYVFQFKDSDTAAGLARQALGAAGLQLYAAGRTIKLAAYAVQHQAWSKEEVADRPARLAAVEAASENPIPPADDQIPALQRAASGVAPLPITAAPSVPPYTPLVAHALQLAAIAALGEATDQSYNNLTSIMSDDDSAACLHMAKLNLHQCLAVAKPNYEDIFCLGQHAMSDTGACLAKNAGMDVPAEPPPVTATPAKAPKKTKRSHG